tara:strand:+ start:1021 stop:1701 length:681 start_codon:yes stop_codon:yes gene_type:complete
MARFKQRQIRPGRTKLASNALQVQFSEAVAINDIVVPTGVTSDGIMTVHKADAAVITKCRGPFYIVDRAFASGVTGIVYPSLLIQNIDTSSAAVGDAVYLSTGNSAGGYVLGSVPAATADAGAFSLNVRVGRVVKSDASTGSIWINSDTGAGGLVGRVTGGGDTTITVTGFTAELDGAPVICTQAGDSAQGVDASIERAQIASGELTITANGALDSSDVITYVIFA